MTEDPIRDRIPSPLKKALAGVSAYMVGGAVRDLVMGRAPKDYDFAVLAITENRNGEITAPSKAHASSSPLVARASSAALQIARALEKKPINLGKDDKILFRIVYGDLNIDISPIQGNTIYDDLKRRDFTINAMAYNIETDELIDITGGLSDISEKNIRMTSDRAFTDDPIRLLRAFRFASELGFNIGKNTLNAIKKHAALIIKPAGERIRDELVKMLVCGGTFPLIQTMDETGVLAGVFPELDDLKGCEQNKHHSFDAFHHTLNVYRHMEACLNHTQHMGFQHLFHMDKRKKHYCFDKNRKILLLKLTALLHDVGKKHTKTQNETGIHFYGHEKTGAEKALEILTRLHFSNKEIEFVTAIIKNHLRPLFLYNQFTANKMTDKAANRFFMRTEPFFHDLMLHAVCDMNGKIESTDNNDFKAFIMQMMDRFENEYMPEALKKPFITGNDLKKIFGLSPSPLFKTLLNRIEEERFLKTVTSREEALKKIAEYLKNL